MSYVQVSVSLHGYEHVNIPIIISNCMSEKAYLACIKKVSKINSFHPHGVLCHTWDDSPDFSRDMFKRYNEHTTNVRNKLH